MRDGLYWGIVLMFLIVVNVIISIVCDLFFSVLGEQIYYRLYNN